jgi:hypothetical protein
MSRSYSLIILALAALALAVFNGVGALNEVQHYGYVAQLPLALPLTYLMACRVIWAGIWTVLAVGAGRRLAWARAGMLAGSALYLAHGWVNRLVWGRSDYLTVTQLWAAVVGVLGVAVAWWIVLGYRHWGEKSR